MKLKKTKSILFLFSIPLATSSIVVRSSIVNENNILESKTNSNTNTLDTTNTIVRNTMVNSIGYNDAPQNFSQVNPLFQTNSSPSIATSYGYLGYWKSKNVLFMTSYSGFLIWWQDLRNNNLVKNFYASNNLTITNANIQEFAYLEKKDAIVILMGDKLENQSIVMIDAKTGLLWNPTVDNSINVTSSPIYSVKSVMGQSFEPLTRLYKISDDTIIGTKLGDYSTYKNSMKITLGDKTANSSVSQIILPNIGSSESDLLIGIIKASNNRAMALIRDTNETESNNKTYKLKVRLIDISDLTNSSSYKAIKELSNTYISSANESDNSYMNFSYIYNGKIYLLTGNKNQRILNELSISNDSINENITNRLDLSNYEINTIVADSGNNVLYIGNKATNNQSVAGYIDLNKSITYQSMIKSSSSTINPYYVVPVLEKIGNSSRQNVLYSDSSQIMKLMYRNSSNETIFVPSSTTISLIDRDWNMFGNITKNSSWFTNRMASNLNWSDVSSAISFSEWKSNTSTSIQGSMTNKSNDDYGWTELIIKVTYNWSFDTTQKSSFEIPVYINGFYQLKESFQFQFVTSENVDSTKWKNIQELMNTKFAKDITKQDVFDNFWIGTIKDKNGNNVTINQDMFSISYSNNYDQLNVILKLPSNSFPTGFPHLNYVYQFSGFLSISGYDLSVKSDNDIKNITSQLYPSELTKEKVLDFLNIGTKIKKDISYWDINISNQDDINGTATVSIKYNYEKDNDIPDKNNFPISRFNVVENKQISTFKNLKNSFNNINVSIADVTSNLLPSDIWQQYLDYLNGTTSTSSLIENLKIDFVNVKNVKIQILNEDSCDADKMLKLNLIIEDNAPIDVYYSGNQLPKNDSDKLLFSSKIKEYLTQLNLYPLTLEWNITTTDKVFEVLGPDGNYIQQVDNIYYIDVREIQNSDYILSKNQYAKDVDERMLSKLIQIQGYTYTFQDYEVNNDKGYILATLKLSLDKTKETTNIAKTTNQNFLRKIYVYNFKLPLPDYINTIIYSVIGTIGIVGIIWSISFVLYVRRNKKYSKLGKDQNLLSEKRKKQKLWEKKYILSKKIQEKNTKK